MFEKWTKLSRIGQKHLFIRNMGAFALFQEIDSMLVLQAHGHLLTAPAYTKIIQEYRILAKHLC